ncbi:MAG: hypothetical protein M0Z40_10080, partial [Actinomycetota bacterium]|nr:hypothetical protein [Actinomycetota bacterium]
QLSSDSTYLSPAHRWRSFLERHVADPVARALSLTVVRAQEPAAAVPEGPAAAGELLNTRSV